MTRYYVKTMKPWLFWRELLLQLYKNTRFTQVLQREYFILGLGLVRSAC